MKKLYGYLSMLTILFIAGACNNQNNTTTEVVKDDVLADNPDSLMIEESIDFEGILDTFPKYWLNVEVTKDGNILHEYCDIPTPFVKIAEDGEYWKLTTGYGHDAEDWQLVSMTGKSNAFNNQQLQEGILIVKKLTYPDDELYEIDYFWNKSAAFCTFGDFFQPDTKFVDESAKDSYQVVEEPCDM